MPARSASRARAPLRPAAAAKAPTRAPRWLYAAILALAALYLVARFSTEVGDTDAWWHLKTGQYIVQHHQLPVPDPFCYTTYRGGLTYAGEERTRNFNLRHEWLAQIAMYLAWAGAGYAGLVLLKALQLTLFCGLVGLVAWRRTGEFYRAVGAALAVSAVAQQFAVDRPYLMTYILLAATIAILEFRRGLWFLPPLFVLWANWHGGYFMGWLVLGIYCAEALYLRWRGRPLAKDAERRLWLVSALSILASGINPNGFAVIPVMVSYRASVMQSQLWEWQYPKIWELRPYPVLLFVTVAVILWAWRRLQFRDWLLFLAFTAISLTALRNIILIALVGPFLIAQYLPERWRLPRAAEYLAAALLLAGSAWQVARGDAFQFRSADWKNPVGAANFVLAHHITAPMFNTYEEGGYLIWRLWPQERVFIDGRALNEKVWADYQCIVNNHDVDPGCRKSAEDLLDEYAIQVILMKGFEWGSGTPYLLPAALSDPAQTKWKLVYRDAQAVIYMRQPPAGVPVLNSFEALSGMESECTDHIAHTHDAKCASGLAGLFERIGDTGRARKWAVVYEEMR